MGAGETAAAAEFYDATCHLVFGLALRILRDHAAAEDVAIEVYTQAWNLAPSYDDGRGSASGWLLTLARSRALDALRARRRDPATETLDDVVEPECDRPGPEAVSLAAERHRFVNGALTRLSADKREVIHLAYFAGLSHSQIAARLGQPLGTVKTRIRQGMIQLREILGPLAPATADKGMS
jgi:RNA polymerase sigma-70 factor (ECF subfamily)